MSTHRATRLGITALTVVALVASGASPISAVSVPTVVSPTTTLTMPVRPSGLAVDGSGNAYVAAWGVGAGTEVFVFDAGTTSKNDVKTLTGLSSPWDVAVKASTGEVFVSNYAVDSVSVFAAGNTTASRVLTGVNDPTGLAFDNSGRLLVGSAAADLVYVFEGVSATPTDTIPVPDHVGGMAVDPLWNRLYVTYPRLGFPGTGGVGVFEIATKAAVPGQGLVGLNQPMDVAFQASTGLYYVSEWGAGTGAFVKAYSRSTDTLDATNSLAGLAGPWGVAVSPATQALYVSDTGPAPGQVHAFPGVTSSVTSVNPAVGPVTGGTVVSIEGTNLGAVTQVTFNGVVAEQIGPTFPTTLPVKVPAATLSGPVTVQVKWGVNTVGKVDAFTYTAVAPGVATGVTGVPGNGQVTVSWTAPAFNGGAAITGYVVTPSPGGTPCSAPASTTSCTVSGLTNGQPYQFTVTSTNAAALSSTSAASAAVTPVISVWLKVKAKKASYRPPRRGVRTLVSYAKKSSKARLVVTPTCTNGSGLPTNRLCSYTVSKKGKVKVRVKGFRKVQITIAIQAVPRASAGPSYGPSPIWTRTWRAK